MRRTAILVAGLSVLLLVLLLGSCSNLILAKKQTITFALVIDDPGLDGEGVYAVVRDNDASGAQVDEVSGTFGVVLGSSTTRTADMLSTTSLPTAQRYHLDFYIDLDDSLTRSTGDRTGIVVFDVMPNATHCEVMFFAVNLDTEP